MPVPESQLSTWSHQGSISQSCDTYATVRTALLSDKAIYAEKDFNVFLQGSYGNDTNIYAESDVDVVIRLDSIMRSDVKHLPADQQVAYYNTFSNATYSYSDFKSAVELRLQSAFGSDVKLGNKAIQIKASGSRRKADVVVCYLYRYYHYFHSEAVSSYTDGIIFPSQTSGEIINFPKLHSKNLTAKHQRTSQWFKPVVRIFKNLRSRLVDKGLINSGTAPSYYLEGLLYNVPDDHFGSSYQETALKCARWILNTDRSKLGCAHEQYLLLGQSNVQWPTSDCDNFLLALINLWDNW